MCFGGNGVTEECNIRDGRKDDLVCRLVVFFKRGGQEAAGCRSLRFFCFSILILALGWC